MKEAGSETKGSRRSREEAAQLVTEFKQSGMSRKAFCRERGVSAHTLDYYRRRYGAGGGLAQAASLVTVPQLAAVELVEAAQVSSLRVELANGRRIVVEPGFDAALLQRVVQALES